MKKHLLAAVVAGLLATTAPAHASGGTFRGNCGFDTTNNPTGSGALGGRNVWTGVTSLDVVTTDPSGLPTGSAVTAWCELRVNGVSQGTVLGPVSGVGAVAAAAPLQFRAAETDVVTPCLHVVTAAGENVLCTDRTQSQIPPQPVLDLIDFVLGPAYPTLDEVRTTVYDPAIAASDAAACTALGGDTFAGPYWLYDCPPFEEFR